MDFRILGPLEVWDGERQLEVAGPKRRAVLAFLLLHANEVVGLDRLVDQLWGENAPRNAAAALHTHVSRLRKQLGSDVIARRAWGYVLRCDPDALDLKRFERQVAAAESLPARERARHLGEALALWRGAPLEGLSSEPALAPDIARLEELRLSVLENRVDADLEAGNQAGLVGELEALIALYPLRERLRGQLILALYRSGRQAEALEVYRETRRVLADELGLEPSPELRELERAILQQDPVIRTNPVGVVAAVESGVPPGRRRRIFIGAILALLLAGLGAATAYALSTRTTSAAPPATTPISAGKPNFGLTNSHLGEQSGGSQTTPPPANPAHQGDVTGKPPQTTAKTSQVTTTQAQRTQTAANGDRRGRQAVVTFDSKNPRKANLGVGLYGWGHLRFARLSMDCRDESCTGPKFTVVGRRVVFTESESFKGWKFSGWQGACDDRKPHCVVDYAHVPRNADGIRYTWVHATFTPVGLGISRGKPIPIGKTAGIGQGFLARVNSVTPDFQTWMSPQPGAPAGAEYFVANVTMTYTGGDSAPVIVPSQVMGKHNAPYTTGRNPCPDWPNRPLLPGQTLYSGQSATGNICWTIASNDESSLELYFGMGSVNYPGTTWFALYR
jgi:DNA-binding SARP family transcriptional activator